MKTLTKPVKSRLPFPCIYGYEDDGNGTDWFYDGESITEYGDPPETTWYTTYYVCDSYGEDFNCLVGDTMEFVDEVHH